MSQALGMSNIHIFFLTAVKMVVSGQLTCKSLASLQIKWFSLSLCDITYCKMGISRQRCVAYERNAKNNLPIQSENQ